jgi:hypothetical protein
MSTPSSFLSSNPYEAIEKNAVVYEKGKAKVSVLNIVFVGESVLLAICAVFLVRQLTFVAVVNGLFLFAAAAAIAFFEFRHPDFLATTFPLWNSSCARGLSLLWLSVIGMEGLTVLGAISFVVSILIVVMFFFNLPVPRAIFAEDEAKSPLPTTTAA